MINEQRGSGRICLMEINYCKRKKERKENTASALRSERLKSLTAEMAAPAPVDVSDPFGAGRRHKHKLSKGSKVDFNQLKGDKT